MRVLLLGVAASLTLSTVALAQPSKAGDAYKMAKDDCARARKAGKTCVLDMDADTFEGSTPAGDGSTITSVGFTKQPSLIRIRRDFIREIIKSAEDL